MEVVSGTVSDPSGAKIQHASVTIHNDILDEKIETDGSGHFSISLPAGNYTVTIASPGFSAYVTTVTIRTTGRPILLQIPLAIAERREAIVVPLDGSSTSSDDSATAMVFRGADLNSFSQDDATFQKELLALAGADGSHPPQIFVDGFSSSRVPPKTSILAVRVNRNSYSAAYDSFGVGRVEISTRPGGETLHGEFDVNATDNVFNAQNPYIVTEPPYYLLNFSGHLSGSLNRKTAFFLSGLSNDQQNNAALNAVASQNQLSPYQLAIPNPQIFSTYGLRLDRQVTPTNNATARYEFNQLSITRGGLIAPLTIATQAFNSGVTGQTLQLIDTQVFGSHIVSESHLQYLRDRTQQNAVSNAPTLLVQGAFNDGGNPSQSQRDNQDRFEFQHALSIDRGTHYLRFGARYRLLREANLSTANYNGQFIFPSLTAYIAKQPSQYSITTGQYSATVLTGDFGAYAEDEWKVTRSITVDLGFRLESQSAIPDHLNPAPRIGAAWALHRKGKPAAFLTLRGGAGLFYDRFASANILTSIRQNGISQQTFLVQSPPAYPAAPSIMSLAATPPTIYRTSPNFKAEYGWIGGVSAEKIIGKYGRVGINYIAIRGVHQSDSQNVNAPLPGTYNTAIPGSGIRPLGGTQNIYEFDSNGISKQQALGINSRLSFGKYLTAFLSYNYTHQNADVSNATTFVSNSFNLAQDYGRSAQPTQQLFIGGTVQLPLGISVNLFGTTQGGVPFNITTGTDLNGDSIYNDRPAFATSPTANSILYKTGYGTFDANPQPGEKIIPINYGHSPDLAFLDLSASRTLRFGPRAAPAHLAGTKPAPLPDPPFAITFTVDSPGVLNHRNPGQPVAVLSSPLFGQSISLNNPFTSNTAANRVIFFQTSFTF